MRASATLVAPAGLLALTSALSFALTACSEPEPADTATASTGGSSTGAPETGEPHATFLAKLDGIDLCGTEGATGRSGWDLVSYLAFEPGYIRRLLDLGYKDTMAREKEILAFFA